MHTVTFFCFRCLATLITDLKIAVHNDFHLIVSVGIDERRAWVEAVKASGDRSGGFRRAVFSSKITYVSMLRVFGLVKGVMTNEVDMSARYAFSFAISGRVLVNSV